MDFLLQDMMHAQFWIAALQIIGVNIILSGDNAVVIAMACMTLPPKQRLWGMIFGAGAVEASAATLGAAAHLSILGALLLGTLVFAPWATALALKIAIE